MERAFVSAALGFALAILLAVASVELVGINPALAASLMQAAIVLSIGVAGILVAVWALDSRLAARRRAVAAAATPVAAGDVSADGAEPAPLTVRVPEIVPWVATPSEVVIAAPTATAWDPADVELAGTSRQLRRGAPRARPRWRSALRHGEPLSPRQWYEAVEAADLDGVFLDPRAHDDEPPVASDAWDDASSLLGRGRATRRVGGVANAAQDRLPG